MDSIKLKNIVKIKALHPTQTLIKVSIIDQCNFKCSYCCNGILRSNAVLDLSSLYDSICYIAEKKHQPINLEIIGGEPSLHPKLLNFCKAIQQSQHFNECAIYSNFSANPSLYKDLLELSKIKLCVSWHSDRIDPTNKQYYANLQSLSTMLGIQHMRKKVFCIIMLEHQHYSESISMYKMILDNMQIKTMLMMVHNTKLYKHQYMPYQVSQYFKLIELSKASYKQDIEITDEIGQHICLNKHMLLNGNYVSMMPANFKGWTCAAGKDYLYINFDGAIYPCQQYYESSMAALSHIYDITTLKLQSQICKCNTCKCETFINKHIM